MARQTDIRLLEIQTDTEHIEYRAPIKFGGRVVTSALIFNVRMTVENRAGQRGEGFGSMPLGNVWAWPSAGVTPEQSLQAMLAFANRLQTKLLPCPEFSHPLQLTRTWETAQHQLAREVVQELGLSEGMPRLAQLVAASPYEAAAHDAFGRAANRCSYDMLGADFIDQDLSHFLTPEFAGEYLDRYTSRVPKATMPLYHLVGALDPLTDADIKQRLNDGLPETLGEWILADGLTHLKIKLAGDNLDWDIQRVIAVDQAASAAQAKRGLAHWNYSLDFNEKCASVEYLLEFLGILQSSRPEAFTRTQYVEQPTHRDLKSHPENKMHRAAAIKPVVIDESLIDLETLHLAQEQGYSGVALKACKGHSEALLMGAAAQKYKLFLCVQDLSCPGYSFLHSASIAARLPTIAAIEGNGRQYCPAGNKGWEDRFPAMFHITDGTVGTAELRGIGLGF